jgi:ABC-2 type transport system ATP-binding protein
MPVVKLDRLSRRYGPHRAVDSVSFEIGEREVMGLLGPNGSGKTTILRILTGYLRPSGGSAYVAGLDVVRDGRASRARVGYVPEDAPLYPHMRVDEFLGFMGQLHGLGGEHLRRRIDFVRERLSLNDVGNRIIGRLSRGYRQRVALAQALLHEPDLVVLDEPMNGLDPRQIIELRGLIRDLTQHCAVIVTSHVLTEIERIADRVAILLDGRLLTVRALAPQRTLRLQTHRDRAPRLASVLSSVVGVAVIETTLEGGIAAWRVRTDTPAIAQALLAGIVAAGIAIVEIADHGSDLEETFLTLTAANARNR